MKFVKDIALGDPSTNNQNFIDLRLRLMCCRYWLLDLWDCHDMVFPFWRLYWNKNSGGQLIHQNTVYDMDADHIYIIPPFTSFSSQFKKNHRYTTGIHVSGKQFTSNINESDYSNESLIHFFVHFNLGVPFDSVYPGILKIEMTIYLKERLEYLTERLKIENKNFKLTFNLKLQAFIKEALTNIGPELWKTTIIDERVLKVIRYVEANIEKKLKNTDMSDLINMAPNSFARLFKSEMHVTLHNFIQNRKIAKSCELFEHTNKSIEEVAYVLGFSDRYHFSRVFKSVTGLTPAVYKSGRYT
ncbi:helix-turn-helix transcriptional regulator [Formosa sediminum]|uniref:Helix-turn-helix transcriptional regulator n=1 Tax=Formosa sediminum TaxID=2594004 RepID=A0A516GVC0_9FLAO|nr:AraC family transcriptional regulator [Formosa sediminum]QDO95473.1 helix-turn-helix transcriptional regulator [Formosa sediminum]